LSRSDRLGEKRKPTPRCWRAATVAIKCGIQGELALSLGQLRQGYGGRGVAGRGCHTTSLRRIMLEILRHIIFKMSHQGKSPTRGEEFMKILMVLSSHRQLGNTGRKTGFWPEEFAAPYYTFKDAGTAKGGEPPLDPKSNEPNFQTDLTHRFEADADAQARVVSQLRHYPGAARDNGPPGR
jgi:hypothetical protein